VAVLIEASNAYARGLLAGIHAHLREHEPWTVFLPEHGRGKPPLEALARWHGDGIIARIETPAIARTVADLRATQGVHVVDVSAARLVPGVPYVETDDAAIATVAAEHFFERDFRQVAFLGDRRFQWSDNRRDAFTTAAAADVGLTLPSAAVLSDLFDRALARPELGDLDWAALAEVTRLD
jgi:LacI family transcriptional regulator